MHPVYTFKRDIRFGSLFCISYMPYALQFELPLGMMSFFYVRNLQHPGPFSFKLCHKSIDIHGHRLRPILWKLIVVSKTKDVL